VNEVVARALLEAFVGACATEGSKTHRGKGLSAIEPSTAILTKWKARYVEPYVAVAACKSFDALVRVAREHEGVWQVDAAYP
jgi:hypothetical protein